MRFGKKKTFIDHATELAESALESLESAYESAKETAGPVLSDARDRAVPLLDQGRALAAEKAADGRAYAAEKAAEGRALAAEKGAAAAAVAREKAAEGRAIAVEQASSGKNLAAAKIARLKGEEPEPQGSKLKKLLLLTGLLAVAGFVAKTFRDRQATDNWESSYVPPAPAPVRVPSPTDGLADPLNDPLPGQAGVAGDDPGGAGPDEAMSDAVESPHAVTTPDDPADVVDVDSDRK